MIAANWHVVNEELVIASIQKNASTAMTRLYPEKVNHEKALTFPRRVMWIRHPIDRLVSAFKNRVEPKAPWRSWHDFLDYILRVPNVHWEPQINLVTYNEKVIPNEWERFEGIEERWNNYSDLVLPKVNVSSRLNVRLHEYRREELLVKYVNDFQYWMAA
jgi:hypothetical protein